ncbi:MAG TPA: class I SAM-dependent methyltransferase [Micromonosporaceae bacterium]|jgi:SAM-dependent methyltransferase
MDSDAWDARYAAVPDLVWSREPNRFVVEELADLPPGRAIDLAAGEGRNALWLAERGWQVTAVDFSGVAIDRGRRLADEHKLSMAWLVTDLAGYVPPAGEFDLVLIAYLHLPADEMAVVLRRAAAALAPGGTLLLVGHDLANLEHGVGGPQDPRVLHTPEAVTAALPGLRVERAATVRRPVPTDDGSVDALDTLVRAVRDQT